MPWLGWTLLATYLLGFAVILVANLTVGPLTFSLCLARALVWPVWITTGWPHGTPLRMD